MSASPTLAGAAPAAAASPQARCRRRFVVHGIVQGVGFRPFVYRLARRLRLGGTVRNFTGGVEIEVEGPAGAVASFAAALVSERPPASVIADLLAADQAPSGETEFVILPSLEQPGAGVLIAPDLALCADCRRELLDPADRRYGYPFLNCTNCGPRYTITAHMPYDRSNTSMAPFAMCPACAREYADPADRRYHAQPTACPRCGPRLEFVTPDGTRTHAEPALRAAGAALRAGQIIAVKGLGGFHLACDARNEAAVQLLRRRKGRERKPFAVMLGSLADAAAVVQLGASEAELLLSAAMPIVLAPQRRPAGLAAGVAPGSADYGVLLPYTPLHRLLLDESRLGALVMTSGNLSDEPLCVANGEAWRRLGRLCDGFLWHDREILVGCDDSVVRSSARGPIMLRRARGYAPLPVSLAQPVRPLLAVGGQLKGAVCLARGSEAVLSQHLGDLDDELSLQHFARTIAHLQETLELQPQAVACDAHPGYRSTRWARVAAERLAVPLIATQHHHAHLVSCLADNGVTEAALGLICDGTGYGADGTIWGCEVLEGDAAGCRRLGHLRQVPLPGGEAAVREPWRMAGVYLQAAYGDSFLQTLPAAATRCVASEDWPALSRLLARGVNCPPASSAGRLFDAVAALLGLCSRCSYEGQAAMALETIAAPVTGCYPYACSVGGGELRLDPLPMFSALVDDLQHDVAPAVIAGRFHETFARLLADAAGLARQMTGCGTVALSGGTFQNRLLLERLSDLLETAGFTVLRHRALPPNDGGLSLGQAVIAEAWLSDGAGAAETLGVSCGPGR